YKMLTVSDIIKYSSNIGCTKISQSLGKEKFYNYITKFGFGAKTGIDVPAESSGLLRPIKQWSNVDSANIAFGQGISVTPIQMIAALCSIANGGNLLKPYIVSKIIRRDGKVVKENTPTVVRRVISQETAKEVALMMTRVVNDPDGTGKLAKIDDVLIAGKTGTAQKYDRARGVFSREKVRASFVGFLPAQSPRFVMLVSLDEPQIDRWGGIAAAPVFKKISEEMISRNLAGIAPKVAPTTHTVPQEQELPDHMARQQQWLRFVSTTNMVIVSNESKASIDETKKMPEFRGLTIKEVLKIAMKRNLRIAIKGSGWAYKQEPVAGVTIGANQACIIYFSDGL
ncbi:MAG: penicillin-binding transpeptidase domain-containing protein, partial [Deltaproteobacteria bacterium]